MTPVKRAIAARQALIQAERWLEGAYARLEHAESDAERASARTAIGEAEHDYQIAKERAFNAEWRLMAAEPPERAKGTKHPE